MDIALAITNMPERMMISAHVRRTEWKIIAVVHCISNQRIIEKK